MEARFFRYIRAFTGRQPKKTSSFAHNVSDRQARATTCFLLLPFAKTHGEARREVLSETAADHQLMSDVEHKYWAVMYNKDGHISMTPSDGKPTPEGTTVSS